MNHCNYSEVRELFKNYREKFSTQFDVRQIDLASEFSNSLADLEQISHEIVDLNAELFLLENFEPNEGDEIEIMGFKLRLKRADPNVSIKLDNATKAYSRDEERFPTAPYVSEKERRLERLASEFYRIAHRVAHIAENLPTLQKFKAAKIRIIRNQLIEHPEGENSGTTHDSFSYSKNEGPFIKGLRVGGQTKHMDSGFKINNEEFLRELKAVLLQGLAK